MSNYWETRQKQLNKWLSSKEAKNQKKIIKLYKQQEARLAAEISAFYNKYGKDNVLEYRLLLQRLSDADAEMLIRHTEQFMAKYPQYAHLAPIRTDIYKLNRLEGLQTSAKVHLLELGALEQAEIRKHLTSVVEKTSSTWSRSKAVKQTSSMNHQLASDIVGARWYAGKNFSDRIWDNKDKLSRTLNTELKNAFIRGDKYKTVENVLRNRFDVGAREAKRLVFTEGTFVMNESKARTFEEYYKEYEYTTMGDGRVCGECRALSGEVFKFSERVPGQNFPPLHPSCRCTFQVADVTTF